MANSPRDRRDDAAQACRRLLATSDADVRPSRPLPASLAGRRRAQGTQFVDTERGVVAATRRADSRMGAIEARVLAELFRRGAPVPRPLAFDGVWLLQVVVQGQRLSQALARATPLSGEALLETALDALERCHQASMAADLARRVPPAPDAGFLLPGLAAVGKAF